MAIEPLGSIMSVQAQGQVQTRNTTQTAKPAAEYMEVSARESASPTDNTINMKNRRIRVSRVEKPENSRTTNRLRRQ